MYKNYKKNYPYNKVEMVSSMKEVLEDSINGRCEGRPAFRYRKGSEIFDVSYEQFYRDTKEVGTAITALGVGSSKIAMMGPNSYDWVTVYLMAMCGDGVFVPIDKDLLPEEKVHIISESDTEIVFFDAAYEQQMRDNRDKMPGVKYFVNLGAKEDDGDFLSYSLLKANGAKLLDEGNTDYTSKAPKDEDLKMIVYTSGTTGRAKGVMLSSHNTLSAINYGLQISNIGKYTMAVLPFHHTFGCVVDILVSLRVGACIGINDNLRNIVPNLKAYAPESMMMVPLFLESFYKRIMNNIEDKGIQKKFNFALKLSNFLLKFGIDVRRKLFKDIHEVFGGRLHTVVVGGAPVREELGNFFNSIGITPNVGYGITECSPLVSCNREYYYNFSSVGILMPCLEVKIDNPNENGEGEILVKGDVVMMGYYKNPEQTAEVLSEDGWFKTGDYGKYDTNEERLYITGRKKNIIVLKNGKNIYPEEIEDYLSVSEDINEVIVTAVKNELGEEVGLQAEIYPYPDRIEGKTDDEVYNTIHSFVEANNDTLPSHKRVTKVVIRKEPFEKTTSGKIRRKYN